MTAASYRTTNGDLVPSVVVLNANADGTLGAAGVGGTGAAVSVVPPAAAATNGVAPAATTVAANALVLKASPGNLYSCYASSTVAGWLMIFNAIAAPADGTVTPIHAIPIAAGGFGSIPPIEIPEWFSVGITAVFSSTGPFTKTASATAFIHGAVK